jgi:hypothetical protein
VRHQKKRSTAVVAFIMKQLGNILQRLPLISAIQMESSVDQINMVIYITNCFINFMVNLIRLPEVSDNDDGSIIYANSSLNFSICLGGDQKLSHK